MRSRFAILAGLLSVPYAHADLQAKPHTGIAGIDFESQLGYDIGYDDNVTWQHDSQDAIGSSYQNIKPVVKAMGERQEDRYLLMYSGDYRYYANDSADNRDNHYFMFNGNWRFGDKHGLALDLEETLGHEERGRDTTEGFLPEQFKEFGIDKPIGTRFFNSELRYSYGAPEGRGKAELALQHKQLRFRDLDSINHASDDFGYYMRDQEWHEDNLVADVFDQKAKTLRYRYSFITNQRRYELNELKDSNEYYLLFGMKNRLTGKTEINGNIAWLYKEFIHNPNSQGFNGLNWDITADWAPLEQVNVNLHSSQRIKDPTDSGGYILVSTTGIGYEHHWVVDRFSTLIDYSYITEDYKHQSDKRKDTSNLVSLTFNYDFRPSINFKLKLQWNTMHSNKDTDTFYIGPDYTHAVDRTLGYDDSAIIFMTQVQI
ncbi:MULTISPECIES: outer membrane beta-barrel protein [Enterobacter]|uniref:outer membrane beta-barrel protein n=1 Tax=Enterobacter TaxID=547 RepID=UPI0028E1DD2E|nr:outer membrane beta-barrel protein [Enterobacter cloacae]WNT38599.1 outer membrane beta-barrel protein [Enterobacter cloacae]HDR2793547.1 outer membrane beta-barrel protein [Enterobacter asburiae]HDR2798854.1 outer membrane beta-barrel protein [Enterobacter asburiae]